jgi:hypothetical protein
MNDLSEDLARRAARFAPDRGAYERVLRRVARRRLARRVLAGVVSFVIAFAALAGLWSATRPASRGVGTPTIPVSIPSSPAPSQQALPYDGLEVASSERVGGWIVLADPYGVRVAGGRTLTLVDPQTGTTTPAGRGPWDYDYTVLAEHEGGTVFLASGGTLWELTLDGTVIHRFDLGTLGTLDAVHVSPFDRGSLWVAGSGLPTGNVVARVDIDTGRVLERYEVGQGLHQITDAGGYVFVASRSSSRTVVRIDPRTGALRTVPDVWSGWTSIVGVRDRLWVEEGNVVHCIEATDVAPCGEVGEIQIPRAQQLAADDGLLWVLSGTGSKSGSIYIPDPKQPATVTLIDGTTGALLGGPTALPDTTPATISAFSGRSWVGFHDSGRLVEIDRCAPGSCTTRSS